MQAFLAPADLWIRQHIGGKGGQGCRGSHKGRQGSRGTRRGQGGMIIQMHGAGTTEAFRGDMSAGTSKGEGVFFRVTHMR